MAVFPCDWSAHRYPGPQRSVYVTSAFGDDVETYKLRLCAVHLQAWQEIAARSMSPVDEDSRISRTCENCGGERTFAVYAKVFDAHREPAYFASDLCASCWQALRTDLKVPSGRALRARTDTNGTGSGPLGPF